MLLLDIQAVCVERKHGVFVHDLSYASLGHGRVDAYWVMPLG
jgi:hypothetical protein